MRIPRRGPKCEKFSLDRDRFSRHLRSEFGELVGLEVAFGCGDVSAAVESSFLDARDAGAILGPSGLEAVVYAYRDSLIVAVREIELPSIPTPLRQLATYSFEARYVVDGERRGFDGACATVEDLLERANSLLPSFRALLCGETGLSRRRTPRCLATSGAWRHCLPRH